MSRRPCVDPPPNRRPPTGGRRGAGGGADSWGPLRQMYEVHPERTVYRSAPGNTARSQGFDHGLPRSRGRAAGVEAQPVQPDRCRKKGRDRIACARVLQAVVHRLACLLRLPRGRGHAVARGISPEEEAPPRRAASDGHVTVRQFGRLTTPPGPRMWRAVLLLGLSARERQRRGDREGGGAGGGIQPRPPFGATCGCDSSHENMAGEDGPRTMNASTAAAGF